MTQQNTIGNVYTSWSIKSPVALNASRTLTTSDYLSQNLYAIASTSSAITLDFGSASTLLTAMQAIKTIKVSDTIELRIFNGSNFPLTITNTTDTTNFITLGLFGGDTVIIAPGSLIDLEVDVASLSPAKFFVSGAPTSNGITTVAVTGTSKTLGATDALTLQLCTNAALQTITVPPNSAIAYPIGTRMEFAQLGAGQVLFAPGSGVTLTSESSYLRTRAAGASATITKIATNTWLVVGGLVA